MSSSIEEEERIRQNFNDFAKSKGYKSIHEIVNNETICKEVFGTTFEEYNAKIDLIINNIDYTLRAYSFCDTPKIFSAHDKKNKY